MLRVRSGWRLAATLDQQGITIPQHRTLRWDQVRDVTWITIQPPQGYEHLDDGHVLAFHPVDPALAPARGMTARLLRRRYGTPLVLAAPLLEPAVPDVARAVTALSGLPVSRLTRAGQGRPGRR